MKKLLMTAAAATLMAASGLAQAQDGQAVAKESGCLKCHSVDGSRHIGPTFLDLWQRREKLSTGEQVTIALLSMALIFLGLFLFFGDQLSPQGFYGNILAVISGVTSAVMMVAFRAQKDAHPEDSILVASLVMAVLGFPSILKESHTLTNWAIVAYLGIFQIGLAFILFTQSIKHIPALEANLIGTLEPILNPVWVYLFLGEAMGAFALVGGLVVLAGVIVSAVGSARAET